MRFVVLALTTFVAGCGYDLSFRCKPGGPDCPVDTACPAVPLGSGGCEDLPALFDNDSIPADLGRPVGCQALLPYGNPYYGATHQAWPCVAADGAQPTHWSCPI